MPTTRKRRPAAAEIGENEKEETMPDADQKSGFDICIAWTGTRAIPPGQLLTRLEALSQQLRDTAQVDDEETRESIRPIAGDLVSNNLLHHKDKGVRISAIACIVDIFRIFAPDAPYKPGELKVCSPEKRVLAPLTCYIGNIQSHHYHCRALIR